ncbi:MAG: transporter substrate-binding domain-containing protein [Clostridiales bacterium]|nr:transporter substrate-binding domain-containing protein [Clostridiales bacterium]
MRKKINQTKPTATLLLLAAVVVFSTVFLAGCGSTDDGQISKELPILKAGYSQYPYPPLHYSDSNGELVGFDIDLAREAADIMNVEIEFVPINWAEGVEALESGDVDMLWGGLERASLDEHKVKFTKSYLRSNIVLLMNVDRDYAEFKDLQGLSVCALNFTAAFNYLKVYNRDVIKSQRSFTPPEYQNLMDSLSSGEFDCMITDTSFASFFLKEHRGETYKMSDTVMGSNYAVAVRIDDTELFDQLQAALDELEADGTIDSLSEKWVELGPYQPVESDETDEPDDEGQAGDEAGDEADEPVE